MVFRHFTTILIDISLFLFTNDFGCHKTVVEYITHLYICIIHKFDQMYEYLYTRILYCIVDIQVFDIIQENVYLYIVELLSCQAHPSVLSFHR